MISIKCDMKNCSNEINKDSVKKVHLLDKIYDFCPECLLSLELFIKHRMNGGELYESEFNKMMAELAKSSPTQGVMLPDYGYYKSMTGVSSGSGNTYTVSSGVDGTGSNSSNIDWKIENTKI